MAYTIRFLPDDVSVPASHGDNLLSVAAAAGIFIRAACGGDGVCGKCRVKLVAGELHTGNPSAVNRDDSPAGTHLACTSTIIADATISIPAILRADGQALQTRPKTTRRISSTSLATLLPQWQVDPPVRKICMRLPAPTIDDNIPDMQRLLREYRRRQPERAEPDYDHPEFLVDLSDTLRQADWLITVIVLAAKDEGDRERIIAVEPGDTTGQLYGLALDIGTTTMSGVLLDLNTGEVIAEASRYNRQVAHGEDVIARIIFAERAGGLAHLQKEAVRTINDIIEEVCRRQLISPSDISFIMAAGNTVMTHLLLGINPRYIRRSPYVPSLNVIPLTRAADLGIMAHPSVRLFLYPCIASYVGGDIVAGVHACRIHASDSVSLFIDIGTNGEIVVGNRSWMVCAACSAGPAFEGGGIRYGMRASSGAIENIHLHSETLEPMIVTVGNTTPRGICGSGLIALVPELLAAGIIDQRGKFTRNHRHQRIRQGQDGWEYVIAWASDSQIGEDIVITEIDLDNLIRAKGAMFAGYQTLLDSVGLTFDDIDRLILAGNFGAHIDLERAIAIGLLPDIDRGKFHYLGNGSLLGCQISLTDHRRWRERTAVRSLMTNLELSEISSFMHYYLAALFLPHTDARLFPSQRHQ